MYHGVIGINKPRGMTSHDVVGHMRRLLHMRRIGHTGTLDPDVDGVLVICLGQATKLVEILMESPKSYQGEVTLGYATETEDASGKVIKRTEIENPVSDSDIDQAMQTFVGEITQVPPYYSAVKVNGRKLYHYARQGIRVERPSRQVTITQFTRTQPSIYNVNQKTQSFRFQVNCSKGTYVRTLAVDLGAKLGYPAHMSDLTRTQTSGFKLSETYTLDQVAELVEAGELETMIKTPRQVVDFLPQIQLRPEQQFSVLNGQVLDADTFAEPIESPTALIIDNQLAAIYHPHPNKAGFIKPFKMFMSNTQERRVK